MVLVVAAGASDEQANIPADRLDHPTAHFDPAIVRNAIQVF